MTMKTLTLLRHGMNLRASGGMLLMVLALLSSCRAIKPYEKEYLVHPIMDEGRVARLSAPYGQSVRPKERLGLAGAASGASTSCPTCGG